MIWNEWTISLIIGGLVLLISVPLLLWIRYGKNGKKAFAPENMFKKENKIKALKLAIIEQKKHIANLETKKDDPKALKKAKKQLIGLQREYKNKNI